MTKYRATPYVLAERAMSWTSSDVTEVATMSPSRFRIG